MTARDELAEPPAAARPDDADPRDRFHRGVLMRLRPGSQTGLVRTGNGREIEFALRDIRLLGAADGFAGLREGMEVGFDLGWTSRGVRVTMLKVW
ncbi:MAG TPA: hypothetical protein VGK30_02830 [Candidatus Binatia bacterium]|jgi:hypothetical protein